MDMMVGFRRKAFVAENTVRFFLLLLVTFLFYIVASFSGIYLPFWGFGLISLYFLALLLWRTFRIYYFHQPALLINASGFRLVPDFTPFEIVVAWSDMQKIAVIKDKKVSIFCIFLRDEKAYVARLSWGKRIMKRIMNNKERIFMDTPLHYLDKSGKEIFQEMRLNYSSQLEEYQIGLEYDLR